MKLSLLLIFLACFKVSASVYAQTITLHEKDAPLAKVFKQIERQSGYSFFYKNEILKNSKPVTLNLTDVTLSETLEYCFKDQPFVYEVIDNTIIVKTRDKNIPPKLKAPIKQPVKISGKVTDTTGAALPGASIRIKGNPLTHLTTANGEFSIETQSGDEITISYIGYKPFIFTVSEGMPFLNVILHLVSNSLNEVVVATGYQELPKERATGSFVQIDNKLLNRSVSTGILDRLNGVTSGLIFNNTGNRQFSQANIEIRGRSTLFSNANPLVVLDNFPYEGDVNNINPNDIESISILKDAAAASAWGSRSGNGVIVITTKKGRLNAAPMVSVNSNVTIGQKPNLFYVPQISSSDFIEVEQFLFKQGRYDFTISDGFSALSPAVEIFAARRDGTLTAADSLAAINRLKGYDSRNQVLKYYYRPSVNQQYQASISGGSKNQKYFVSAGYDKNLNSYVNSAYNRVVLNASNTYYLLNNKLELFSNIYFTNSRTNSGPVISSTSYPYDQIADESGKPLAIANTLRLSYASTAGNGKLLNWLYKPLDELNNKYSSSTTDLTNYRINMSLSYKLSPALKAIAMYNYEKGNSTANNLNELQSYYTRNLINTFTQVNSATGAVTYPIPLGAIQYTTTGISTTNNGRFQLNFDNIWGKHAVSAVAGSEIRDYSTFSNSNALYGYNPEAATNLNSAINHTAEYPYFYGYNTALIPTNASSLGTTNRFFSYYFNGSYTYDNKYIASVSARRDESNLFGVSANQKGVPLWSAGLAWIINNESFYKVDWLPQLKLRATYGYTGNVNNSISAYLTSYYQRGVTQTYNTYFTSILNPPNPSLKWEENRNINVGVDFSTKGNRVSGSIDFWFKKGVDLIGSSPIAPQTGISTFVGNSANTLTNGVDVQINTVNVQGPFQWLTTLLFNYSKNKVTAYQANSGTNLDVVLGNYNNPLVGYPYYSVFSFPYAGLDASGNPQGYVNGSISEDYTAIMNSTDRSGLVYKGSAVPTSFGSIRNTFLYKGFDFSANITYKLGYYFRRTSLNNDLLYGGNYQTTDYALRWQKPGDETSTNIPSLIYPSDLYRTSLYTNSEVLVEKADHIRLQDVRLGYTFKNIKAINIRNLNVFTYVNNIGILWRANKRGIDPDYPYTVPAVRTVAVGFRADL